MMVKTKIPEGWKTVELAETASKDKNSFIDGDWIEAEYIVDGGIRIIQTGNVGIGEYIDNSKHRKYISEKSFSELKCKKVFPGDLLICRLADPIGRACIAPSIEDFYVTSVDVVILRTKEKEYDKGYILYYLNDNKTLKRVAEVAGGSTRQRVSRTNLGKLTLNLPISFSEQQKISKILLSIDNTIEKTKELIEKSKKIKQGLMNSFFKEETNYKRETVVFEKCIEKIIDFRGKTPKKIGMEWNGGDIPALSANNVEMGKINFQKETYYGSIDLYQKWMNKGDLEIGDIIMTMEAPLGNVVQIPDDKKYILSQRVIALRPKSHIDKTYLAYYLMSDSFQKQLFINSTGTTALGIQQARLIKIELFLHNDKNEQIHIASILSSMDNKIQSEENYLKKLVQMKAGLMQVLLTGDRRVKLEAS